MDKDIIELFKIYHYTKDEQVFQKLVLSNLEYPKNIAFDLSKKIGLPYKDLYE
jgi:hypothetical protein